MRHFFLINANNYFSQICGAVLFSWQKLPNDEIVSIKEAHDTFNNIKKRTKANHRTFWSDRFCSDIVLIILYGTHKIPSCGLYLYHSSSYAKTSSLCAETPLYVQCNIYQMYVHICKYWVVRIMQINTCRPVQNSRDFVLFCFVFVRLVILLCFEDFGGCFRELLLGVLRRGGCFVLFIRYALQRISTHDIKTGFFSDKWYQLHCTKTYQKFVKSGVFFLKLSFDKLIKSRKSCWNICINILKITL